MAEGLTQKQRDLLKRAETRLEEKKTFGQRVYRGAGDVATQINEGILSSLPIPGARNALHRVGIGTDEAPGPVDAGLRTVGATVPMAIIGGKLLAARGAGHLLDKARQLPGVRGGMERIAQMVGDAYQKNPGAFIAAETGGAFGAGAASEAAGDAGPVGQMAAGLAGGMAGGIAPVAAVNRGQALARGTLEHVAPFTERGGMIRAGRQMQERAASPGEAAIAAQQGREGVTPARRTGDERLMAQEEHLLSTGDPAVAQRVQRDLDAAQQAVQAELRDSYGKPVSPTEWRQGVIQKVAPEGVTVALGDTDQMLNQAYKGFELAYAPARGHRVSVDKLGDEANRAIADPALFAGKDIRTTTRSWVSSQLNAVNRRAVDGAVDSDDLLELRSVIRTRQRRLGKSSSEDAAQARELLESVESVITRRLEASLSDDALAALQKADDSFRVYKLVENAVYRSGDAQLTPQRLSEAIRTSAESGAYARGAPDDLRAMARAGKGVESVMGKPDEARLMVRELSPEDRKPLHAEFVRHLHDSNKTTRADGETFVDGAKLKAMLRDQSEVADALGLSKGDIHRLNRLADELVMMQKRPGDAVSQLFTDGPANLAQLGAALIGAKSGQRVAGRGLGSSLVIASFMSRQARDKLSRLTSDEAERLMRDAVTDQKLFAALLTGPGATPRKRRESARVVNAWVLANYPDEKEEQLTERQQALLDAAKSRLEQ